MVNDTAFQPWDDPAATPLIRFENVSKRFGDFTAIDNLSLDIFEREFFALLGPSGCGKTTLMRMLGGFEDVSEGRITIDGQDMAGVPPNKRAVNMMFQSYALFPHLSVEDNIGFGLRREGKSRDAVAARVDEMVRLTQLEAFRARRPDQLSGGQRQRVALARALAKAPKLLLLDEPLGALDKKLREETQFELMEIQEQTGTTFVIVTHDQEEAMTVASRVAVMREGRIEQVDTPERIYEAPTSVYVADFIGDVNLIEGTAQPLPPALVPGQTVQDRTKAPAPQDLPPGEVDLPGITGRLKNLLLGRRKAKAEQDAPTEPQTVLPPEGSFALHWADGQPPIRAEKEGLTPDGQPVTFAIRPEKITVSAEAPGTANAVRGTVIDIGYLGNVSTYHVALANGQVLKAQMTNARRGSERSFSWDDEVWLGWPETAGLVLPK